MKDKNRFEISICVKLKVQIEPIKRFICSENPRLKRAQAKDKKILEGLFNEAPSLSIHTFQQERWGHRKSERERVREKSREKE